MALGRSKSQRSDDLPKLKRDRDEPMDAELMELDLVVDCIVCGISIPSGKYSARKKVYGVECERGHRSTIKMDIDF